LIGHNSGSGIPFTGPGVADANGNLVGGSNLPVNPRLGPLADNGGPTMTHALLIGGPAINAGNPGARSGHEGVPAFDQRGEPFTRVVGGRIDMGAVESIPAGFLPGDYSLDGVVDATDYALWRNSTGTFVTAGSGADGNGDGRVDQSDYLVWKRNFGARFEELGAGGTEQGVNALFEVSEFVADDEQGSSSDSIPFAFESIRSQSVVLNRAVGGESRDAQEDVGRLQREQGLASWLRGRLMRGDEILAEPLAHEACTLERDADAVDAVMEGLGVDLLE
jgi:hypothetical protein